MDDQGGTCGKATTSTAEDTSADGEAKSSDETPTRKKEQEEEEEVKREVGSRETEEAEHEVQEKKGLRGWIRRRFLRKTRIASTAAATAAADAASTVPEYEWPLPEVAAAEGGREKGSHDVFLRFPGERPPDFLALRLTP